MRKIIILLSFCLILNITACQKSENTDKGNIIPKSDQQNDNKGAKERDNAKKAIKNLAESYTANKQLIDGVQKGDLYLVEDALKQGANINTRDHEESKTVSEIKVSSYTLETLPDGTGLIKYQGEELVKRWTPLMWACYEGKKDMVEFLISKGADLEAVDLKTGDTPLILSFVESFDNVDITELLLDKGANINNKNKNGFSALALAVDVNNVKAIKLLLERGANVNTTNNWEETPLMTASGLGQKDIVQLLIDKGANVNMKSDIGVTALLLATNENQFEIVKLLLEKGADTNIANRSGYTPLKVAMEDGNTKMINLLKSYGAKQ